MHFSFTKLPQRCGVKFHPSTVWQHSSILTCASPRHLVGPAEYHSISPSHHTRRIATAFCVVTPSCSFVSGHLLSTELSQSTWHFQPVSLATSCASDHERRSHSKIQRSSPSAMELAECGHFSQRALSGVIWTFKHCPLIHAVDSTAVPQVCRLASVGTCLEFANDPFFDAKMVRACGRRSANFECV